MNINNPKVDITETNAMIVDKFHEILFGKTIEKIILNNLTIGNIRYDIAMATIEKNKASFTENRTSEINSKQKKEFIWETRNINTKLSNFSVIVNS